MYRRKLERLQLAVTFYPSLIFVGKTESLQLDWIPIKGSSQVGSSLARNH
jgi:hypothetical protein